MGNLAAVTSMTQVSGRVKMYKSNFRPYAFNGITVISPQKSVHPESKSVRPDCL